MGVEHGHGLLYAPGARYLIWLIWKRDNAYNASAMHVVVNPYICIVIKGHEQLLVIFEL